MQHQHARTLEASIASHSSGGASYDGQIAGLYDLEETLGSGHFAVVKLARHVFTGAKVAVKVVDKTKLDDVSKAHLFQEVRCMKLVQHPNVVRLYEVIDTKNKLYLVLELGDGGDLYDYIMKHDGGLNEDLARKYFRQILRAITYCHELHVVHRDLKPENVVFFEKLGVVKLTDFGFSNKFSPGQKLQTFCGSLAYSAPEILLGDSYDAPAVDIWSLGVILYMLVCGQPPFEKANDSETLTMIMDCKYTIPTQVTQTCCKLIASMLVRDPKKRATLKQIAAHPWLQEHTSNVDTGDFLPLVKREQISEEDHAFIIQKMINGNIASKEDILQALDKDKYNHITATYFLLAEICLRKRREELQYKQKSYLHMGKNFHVAAADKNKEKEVQGERNSDGEKRLPATVVPINIVYKSEHQANESKMERRTRKCSIVREEDEEESAKELSCEGNELKVTTTRRESISDGRLNRSIQQRIFGTAANDDFGNNDENVDGYVGHHSGKLGPLQRQQLRPQQTIINASIAVDIDALAQKLCKIDNVQQTATMITSNNNNQPLLNESLEIRDTLRSLEELNLMKSSKNPVLTSGHHRRHTKLHKIRTPSCSSSEASDTDDPKTRSKKKIHKFVGGDAPVRFRMHRRDSHDDSSDSQDQAYQPSANAGHAGHDTTTLITTNTTTNDSNSNSNINNKNDQCQSHNQNTSEESHHQKLTRTHCNATDAGNNDDICDADATYEISNSGGTLNSFNTYSIQTPYHKFKIKQLKEDSTTTMTIDKLQVQHLQQQQQQQQQQEEYHSQLEQKAQTRNMSIHLNKHLRRRRIRESQSLDRITEAQEYDQFRYHQYCHNYQRHRLSLPLHKVQQQTFPVTREEHEIENEIIIDVDVVTENNNDQHKNELDYVTNSITTTNISNNNNNNTNHTENNSIYKWSSIDVTDIIWNEKNFNNIHDKTIPITNAKTSSTQHGTMKCLMAMKKIRKFGKYFPVMNVT